MDICRICLSPEANKNICQTQVSKNKEKTFLEIMLFCLNIQIEEEEDSKVSKMLCLKCYNKVLSFYKFKLLALKNEAYLKSLDSDMKQEVKDTEKTEELFVNDHYLNGTVKEEPEEKMDDVRDYASDDEILSAIKRIKYEYVVEEPKVNAPVKRKRGRPKLLKSKTEEKKMEVCEECGKAVRNIREHLNLHKPSAERKRYKCTLCEKEFASPGARNKHHKYKHLGFKQHCDICNKDVTNVKHHKRVMHDPESLPFECASCGRRFISGSALETHITTHTKDRPFECSQCGKKFRLKLTLSLHIRQVHNKEKSHLCQFCSKSFFKKGHLQVHLRSHTKEKPYTCADCGKCFGSTSVLNNHRTTHSKVKSYQCSLCDASFARLGYLRNHMLSHTKEKRHACKYCGTKFGRSDHRKRHEFTAHEKHMLPAA